MAQLLTHLPAFQGGLIPIANGLLHRYPGIREAAADILLSLQQYPVRLLVFTLAAWLTIRSEDKRSRR
jgi:hypothetical protein